jgi:iron complex outermembrane receptor protein
VPKDNASVSGTKSFALDGDTRLRVSGGVRHSGANVSQSDILTVRTPAVTLVDALAEVTWRRWTFSVNATNLFNKTYYAACRSRGDCFIGADRHISGRRR